MRFEQSFWEVADQVQLPGREDSRTNIFGLVQSWLRDERNGKWLLVMDNVDDADFLFEPRTTNQATVNGGQQYGSTKPLFQYLPFSENGSILLTTRNRDIASKLVQQRDIITVQRRDDGQAVALLERTGPNL